ncbi:MAG: hypothetical protein ACMXYB_05355 [Candidatus Woesearchaeota archaeon]
MGVINSNRKTTVIILGGNSPSHREWNKSLKESLKNIFNTDEEYEILSYSYKHWTQGGDFIDFAFEYNEIKKMYSQNESVIIVAKSVGTLLAFKLIYDNIILPKFCVFMGVPINWAYEYNFKIDIWSKRFGVPTLFLQNSQDPFCSSQMLEEYLEVQKVSNCKLITFKNSTHKYENFEELSKKITTFKKTC